MLTPERKEEIKRDAYDGYEHSGAAITNGELRVLLATLEETEQQKEAAVSLAYEANVGLESLRHKHFKRSEELAEAQQTIARQREALTGAVNKQALLDWLDVEIDLSSGNGPELKADRWAFRQVKKEVGSGRLDAGDKP